MDTSWIAFIDRYTQRYGWTLLAKDVFVCLVRHELEQTITNGHAAILCVYSRALYQSCSGAEGHLRQEQAYSELTTFLDHIAARRYSAVRADATQGALERIYRSFAHCQQPETFLAFALQKLRDAARSELRALQHMEATLSFDAKVEHDRSQITSPDSDPEDIVLQHDMRQRLIVCAKHFVQEHPRAAHQLTVLWLKYMHGLTDLEIAKQFDKTALAVQVQRSRGIARLRRDPDLRALATDLGFPQVR